MGEELLARRENLRKLFSELSSKKFHQFRKDAKEIFARQKKELDELEKQYDKKQVQEQDALKKRVASKLDAELEAIEGIPDYAKRSRMICSKYFAIYCKQNNELLGSFKLLLQNGRAKIYERYEPEPSPIRRRVDEEYAAEFARLKAKEQELDNENSRRTQELVDQRNEKAHQYYLEIADLKVVFSFYQFVRYLTNAFPRKDGFEFDFVIYDDATKYINDCTRNPANQSDIFFSQQVPALFVSDLGQEIFEAAVKPGGIYGVESFLFEEPAARWWKDLGRKSVYYYSGMRRSGMRRSTYEKKERLTEIIVLVGKKV